MVERTILMQMPYFNLTNFQLSLEYELAKTKYTDMLESNCIQKHLVKNIPPDLLNTFQCKYYDEETFNAMVRGKNVSFSMLHINLGSSIKNYSLLKAHLSNLAIEFDIIAITEAGVRNIELVSHMFEGYQFYYKEPMHKTTKGGTGVFVKEELNNKLLRRNDLDLKIPQVEDIWFEVNNTIVAVIYKHPKGTNALFVETLEMKLDIIIKENKIGIICGDININLLQQTSSDVKSYTDVLLSHNFIPTITLPTRITDHSVTLLDHINVYRPIKELGRVAECGNVFFDISDHLPNFITLEGSKSIKSERPYIRIYSEKNISKFKTAVANISWTDVYTCGDTNAAYDIFLENYTKVFDQCFPLVQMSRKRIKDKKWITCALRVSIKHKTRLYRKYLKRPNAVNRAAYLSYKNKLTWLISKAKQAYYTKLLTNDKNNVQQMWKVYSELLGRKQSKSNKIPKLVINGKPITGDHNITDAFNDYFATIGKNLADGFPNNNNYKNYLTAYYSESMFITPVTEEELLKTIAALPLNKAPGLDGIKSNIVKCSAPWIVMPLTHIYNMSFTQAVVPDKLKCSKVIPIYKKKDKTSPGNYRPISLLSIFNKLLEKLMYKRLYSFLSINDIIYDYQFGFRNKHSTILAITEIVDNIREELDKGNSVLGIYLDLSKAFDTVSHEILLYKLQYYGIRGLSNQWFKNYLENRTQLTYVNNTLSSPRKMSVGVPQGSVLGPLLFLIYINDICNSVSNAKTRLFADDTNLFFAGKNVIQLQNEANFSMQRLLEWFTASKLTLNIEKTCFTLFTNKKMVPDITLTLNGKDISRVPVTKYLGMHLDENLNWTHHVEYVINKLVKLKGAFYYFANVVSNECIRQIYYAYVFPYIKYGIEVYGTCNESVMKRLQVEQNKLLKILYKKDRRYGTNKLYSEVKLLKCTDIHRFFIGIFVYKQQNKMLPIIFDNYFILNANNQAEWKITSSTL